MKNKPDYDAPIWKEANAHLSVLCEPIDAGVEANEAIDCGEFSCGWAGEHYDKALNETADKFGLDREDFAIFVHNVAPIMEMESQQQEWGSR